MAWDQYYRVTKSKQSNKNYVSGFGMLTAGKGFDPSSHYIDIDSMGDERGDGFKKLPYNYYCL